MDRLRKHLSTLRNEMKIFSLLKSESYDFVQVKDKFLAALMALLAARRAGIPCFYWLSFPYPEASLAMAKSPGARYPIFYWLRGLSFKLLLYGVICRLADHIFVQSEEMKRVMATKGVPLKKMTAVPMGVDLEMLDNAGKLPRIELGSQTVLYLGALDRLRQLEFLLEAFAVAVEDRQSVKLVFVGSSEEQADVDFLKSEVARLGLTEQVVFMGFLPREQALSYVRAATICVSPIPSNPVFDVASPTKILEYMALAKPVVANDQPDQRQVLEESGAGICTPYDAGSFGKALIRLLDHPEEAREMGARGRRYVKRTRTYAAIADTLEAHYVRLAK